jgi:protease-4
MATDPEAIVERRRLRRRVTVWRVTAVIAAIALVAVVAGRFATPEDDYVARIAINGLITEAFDRENAIRDLADDENAKALIVRINSPGGTTTGSEDLFKAIRHVAGKDKPVVAVIGTVGASGGYIVALAADHIVARETSLTGSIGVMFQTAEFTGLLEKLGVKAEAIKSSPLKGAPSPIETLNDDVRAAIDQLLQDSYAWFSGLVQDRRGLSADEISVVTDGRIFTGRQALKLKLVDQLGGETTARAWLSEQRGVGKDLPAVDIKWGTDTTLAHKLFDATAGKVLGKEPLTLDGLLSVWQP